MTLVDERADERPPVVAYAQVERVRSQTKIWKWMMWLVIALVTASLLAAGAVGWWYLGKAYPESAPGETVDFTVSEDDTVETVIARLYVDGLVADEEVFRWYVDHQGGLELTPGFYQIQSGAHMGDVLDRLRTPPDQTKRRITFPEGFTIDQMGARLEEEDPLLSSAEFIEAAESGAVTSKYSPEEQPSLEGLLFPDTYQVSNADNEPQVIERMASLMERVGSQEEIESKSEKLGMTPYQILTIASIIEREAKVEDDRPKIARVIYNRLALDTELQVDATLYYGTPNFEGNFAELREVDTPYNTYMHKGLPPTPISNPGRASIRAALNPANDPPAGDPVCQALPDPTVGCKYLFYVLGDADGSHVFAATPEQHAANVEAARAKGLL